MGLYSVVSVATAPKYDLTTNIDVTDGFINGENSNRPSIIWVSFPNCDIGRKQLRENMHLYKTNISIDWTPIFEVTRQF